MEYAFGVAKAKNGPRRRNLTDVAKRGQRGVTDEGDPRGGGACLAVFFFLPLDARLAEGRRPPRRRSPARPATVGDGRPTHGLRRRRRIPWWSPLPATSTGEGVT